METKQLFGILLREWREAEGRTLREVAAHLQVSVPHVSDMERGRRNPPSAEKIRSLASFLNRPERVEDLLVAAMRTRDNQITFRTEDPGVQRQLVRLQKRMQTRLGEKEIFNKLRDLLDGE